MRSKFLHLWRVWLLLCALTALPAQADNSATPALLEPINQQLDTAEQACGQTPYWKKPTASAN